jgi:hypothetical protein
MFCGTVADCFVGTAVSRAKGLTDKTKTLLNQTDDSALIAAVLSVPQTLIDKNENPKTDADVRTELVDLGWKKTGDGFDDWKKSRVRQMYHRFSKKFSTVILGEDDLFSKYTFLEKLTGSALRNRIIFSLDDTDYKVSDEDAAIAMIDLKMAEGQANPETYNIDFNMLTDESFSRIFFYGMGSALIAAQEEVSDSEFGPPISLRMKDNRTTLCKVTLLIVPSDHCSVHCVSLLSTVFAYYSSKRRIKGSRLLLPVGSCRSSCPTIGRKNEVTLFWPELMTVRNGASGTKVKISASERQEPDHY